MVPRWLHKACPSGNVGTCTYDQYTGGPARRPAPGPLPTPKIRIGPVRRAYKFRAYPTRPQEGRAVRLLADHCDLYNAALYPTWNAARHGRCGMSGSPMALSPPS